MKSPLVWTDAARARLLPRRRSDPEKSRVYKPGLLAELDEMFAPDAGPAWSRERRARASWLEMRRLLAAAERDAYDEARERVAPRFATGALDARCLIAQAFTAEADAGWAREVASACLGGPMSSAAPLLLGLTGDVALEGALVARLVADASLRPQVVPHLAELVESYGEASVPVLVHVLDALATNKKSLSREARTTLDTLAIVRNEAAARALVPHLARVKALAERFYRDAPELAIATLGDVASGRTKASQVAKTLLERARATERAKESVHARAQAEDRAAAGGAVDASVSFASSSDVPVVLAAPPWRKKKKERPLPVLDPLPPIDEAVAAPVDVRDAWGARLPFLPVRTVLTAQAAIPVAHAWASQPEIAPHAEAWMRAFPELAAVGLVGGALRTPSVVRTESGRALRFLASIDPGAVERATLRFLPDVREAIGVVLALDPREDCPLKAPKLPAFVALGALPVPTLKSGQPLAEMHVRHLVEMLAFTDPRFPYAGLDDVRAACDAASLERFVDALFVAWRDAGASPSHRFALHATSALGGEESAALVGTFVRAEATGKPNDTALAALACLGRSGAPGVAQLVYFAEVGRSDELRRAARAALDEVAARQGVTRDAVAETNVPTLGLDVRGRRALVEGDARVWVTLDENATSLTVQDAVEVEVEAEVEIAADHAGDRAPRDGSPSSGAARPEDRARLRARVDALRQHLEAIVTSQTRRLERAMIDQRRFVARDFVRDLVAHPVLLGIARRVVFATYGPDGSVGQLFRVTEERAFTTPDDEPFTLAPDHLVGVPHPIAIDDATLGKMGDLFADYELTQPFPQLGRTVVRLSPAERAGSSLAIVEGRMAAPGRLFALEARGFVRQGVEVEWYRRELSDDFAALLHISPGFHARDLGRQPPQRLGRVVLSWLRPRADQRLPPTFDDLGPLLSSELARDLTETFA